MAIDEAFAQARRERIEVWIGDYLLSLVPNHPDKVWITHRSGEGGSYDRAEFEKTIRAFVTARF